jgi:hypothetical protein
MAHLIRIYDEPAGKTWRVLSDLEDREEAIREAEDALSARGGTPTATRAVEPVLMPEPEFAPDHDFHSGVALDAAEDVGGRLVLTVGLNDVITVAGPDGWTAKVHLQEILGRGRVMLRVEAPREIRVRSRRELVA